MYESNLVRRLLQQTNFTLGIYKINSTVLYSLNHKNFYVDSGLAKLVLVKSKVYKYRPGLNIIEPSFEFQIYPKTRVLY